MNNCKVVESSVCDALLHHPILKYRVCPRIFLQLFSLLFLNTLLFSSFVQDRYQQLPLWQPVSGITFNLSCKLLSSSLQSPNWTLSIACQASSSFPVRLCTSTTSLIYLQCPFPVPSVHTVLLKSTSAFLQIQFAFPAYFPLGGKPLLVNPSGETLFIFFKGGTVPGRHN